LHTLWVYKTTLHAEGTFKRLCKSAGQPGHFEIPSVNPKWLYKCIKSCVGCVHRFGTFEWCVTHSYKAVTTYSGRRWQIKKLVNLSTKMTNQETCKLVNSTCKTDSFLHYVSLFIILLKMQIKVLSILVSCSEMYH